MFIKAISRINGDEWFYVNTKYVKEAYPPTETECGTVFLEGENTSYDVVDNDEFEKMISVVEE